MIGKIFVLSVLLTGLQGDELGYVFDDQANGWLKLYKTPNTWIDAKIRCETEGAVIATPLDENLRQAILRHVARQNEAQKKRAVIAIYTGVHANYTTGDFLSLEGVYLTQLPVQEYLTSPNFYRNSESCIVWDLRGYAKLRRVRCEYIFPYVCYKRRTQLELPRQQPPPPVTTSSTPSPKTNPDVRSYAPTTGWQIRSDELPQNNLQNQPEKFRTNPQNLPEQSPCSKCSFVDVRDLIVASSNDLSNIRNYIANKNSVTILFTDSATIAKNGSLWHVEFQLKNDSTGTSQHVDEQGTKVLAVTHTIDPQYNNNEAREGSPQTITNPADTQGFTPAGSNSGQQRPEPSPVPAPMNPLQNPTKRGYSRFFEKVGGRFKLHLEPETYDAASIRCSSEGAVIASPLTTDLKKAVTYYIKQNTAYTQFYTGVRADYSNGDFYSTEGVGLNKMPVSLNPGTSTDYQGSDSCIIMTTYDNIVTSVSCTERHPYVCYKKSKSVRSCGNSDPAYEYEAKTQSCYKFHNDDKTWSEAYRLCSDEGGYLAVVNSKEESEALKNLFRKYPKNVIKSRLQSTAYMGLRDWRDGNSWTAVKGVQSPGFLGWAPNEPSNNECSTLGRSGLLFSDPCNLRLPFICEKDSEVLYYDDDQDNPN